MLLIDQPAEAYHANPAIGSTTAKLFLTSPRLFRDRLDGIAQVEDRGHFQIGRLAHLMVLEPDHFDHLVVSQGPVNDKTGKPFGRDTKAFMEWQAANPRVTMVEPWLHLALERMPEAVCALLNGGRSEVSIYQDTGLGFMAKCRPDHLKPGLILDLKTCEDVDRAGRAITAFKYWFSAAWYRRVTKMETGEDHAFKLVFAEKNPPYRWRIVTLAPDYLAWADREVAMWMERIGDCYQTDDWSDQGDIEREEQMPAFLDTADFAVTADGGICL